MFSIIFVIRLILIKSLAKTFSIIFACTWTPGIIKPVDVLTKSNIPCADDPINTILPSNKVLSKLLLYISDAEM